MTQENKTSETCPVCGGHLQLPLRKCHVCGYCEGCTW